MTADASIDRLPAARPGRAIALVLAAMGAFAVMDGLTKILSQQLPIAQIMWVRCLVFFAAAFWLLTRQAHGQSVWALARSRRPVLQFTRALLLFVEMAMFMLAFRLLPLADVTAIAAAAPLVVVALSVPVLGEQVGWRRWLAVLVGFAGVLAIVRPARALADPMLLVALAGAVMWGVYQIMVRVAAKSDRAETTSLWTAGVGVGVTSLIGPLQWVTPDATGFAMLMAIALLGAFGHIALIVALGLSQPSMLQPYYYSQFVWAVLAGFLLFGDVPDRWVLLGASLIIASGVYVWHRERVRARERLAKMQATPAAGDDDAG